MDPLGDDSAPSSPGPAPASPGGSSARERTVYLDHNATTPVEPGVTEAMVAVLRQDHGNPSSIHRLGNRARGMVENARRTLSSALSCTARRIVFTGSGSEANNLAIQGVLASRRNGRAHLITSAVEHPAVLATARALERRGHPLTLLPVDGRGLGDPDALAAAIR